jgi:5-bromo-4-chloroindolyl phosphate hydrolysis protein
MARVNKRFQIKGGQVMTEFAYYILLLLTGVAVIILIDIGIGIIVAGLAIVGIGCELAAENLRYIDEQNRMLRNKRHK